MKRIIRRSQEERIQGDNVRQRTEKEEEERDRQAEPRAHTPNAKPN